MWFGMRQRKEGTDAHSHPEIDALFNPGPNLIAGKRLEASFSAGLSSSAAKRDVFGTTNPASEIFFGSPTPEGRDDD